MKSLQLSNNSSVILSGGEHENIFLRWSFPELQSKGLLRSSIAGQKRGVMRLSGEDFSQVALSTRAGLRCEKDVRRRFEMAVPLEARSFDCGSGRSVRKTRSTGSPSLRMTELFRGGRL